MCLLSSAFRHFVHLVHCRSERKIKAKCISLSSFDPRQEGCNPSMVESMSKRVEGQLFETRASLESYVDLSTLDARLQALALVKKIQSDHDSDVDPRQRTEYLVQILGGIGRYRQIQKVLKDIRDEQQNFETIGGGAVGGRVMTEGMPDAVRDLFVESGPLQHAFEKAPMELLGQLDWTFLIARTQAILRTYREWNGDVLL